ncbi:L-threonylcarbamoyladenylate synthase [Oxalobacter formigenes]|uniref:Threonylcarbamoyl-AMP synthase n=1 Tax=Oxalobacter formigenes OXCC13 TaxID=556269 RepID=C3XAE2_OXAFO|nr:L-threonylcarbamoyladenylate synthase [Oxalobacter formigenes]ARQ45686.1 Threonylcarbamoyl-AMP synthase [Oxalobacter formigenes]ARQ77927.1 threonylcarbamoyl-AMP synthase [Oxalobacter formigenes OXCC13]EEO30168.1 Sua5/YciO/YrdC/YwlC family protein [Oxalobacter formigenes OXCC13]MCZ4063086.1 L-threonylcarbamoyladenylate synthase [Oxalobacter formigenes]QDX33525.1 threonylcarbamoyl-AMP synthase [Oxalobacter formigenes]
MANDVSDDVRAAARMLESGQLVAFPTETVYGLGADAENAVATAAIFALKNRPANHPLIVHVAPDADIGYWSSYIPDEAKKLIDAFWPGPLTLILKKAAHIPAAVAGGQDSIGLRCPSHPVAQALLRAFKGGKGGIAGPSANRFGHVSPTRAEHVREEFGDDPRLAAILEGGQSEVGIESTILDLSRIETAGPVLLRPGKIHSLQIAEVIGRMPEMPDAAAPRASGTLASHYAPLTPVVIVPEKDLTSVLKQLEKKNIRVALLHYSSLSSDRKQPLVKQTGLFCSPDVYSHQLYASLRELDRHRADVILVEATPDTEAWKGVNDRLRRAAYNGQGILEKWLLP